MKHFLLTLGLIIAGIYTCSTLVEVKDEKFDSNLWKSFQGKCSHTKFAMLVDLLKTANLVGMTKTQVKELLGNEVVAENNNTIEYCAGHDIKFTFNRPDHLVLKFAPASDEELRVVSTMVEGPL